MDASAGRGVFAKIVAFESVDSTNRVAADAAREGHEEGLVVVADLQTGGRGRRGRTWEAPARSALLCSVLFRPREGLAPHLAPSVAALAALDAAQDCAGVTLTLKWPNDLLAGAAKVAGILAEIVAPISGAPTGAAGADGLTWPAVVVGLGLNLEWPPGFAPASLDGPLEGLGVPPTTLARAGARRVDRDEVLAAFLAHLERRWAPLRAAGDERAGADVMAAYRQRCSTIGAAVRIEQAAGILEGVARDVRDDGRLVVSTAGGDVVVDAGDVVHLRRVHDTGSITF